MAYYHTNITIKDYFDKQKAAEQKCKEKIKRSVISFFVCVALGVLSMMTPSILSLGVASQVLTITFYPLGATFFALAICSLISALRAISYYKLDMKKIEYYLQNGDIFIQSLYEDVHKFDLFRRKQRYRKPKKPSAKKLQNQIDDERVEKYIEDLKFKKSEENLRRMKETNEELMQERYQMHYSSEQIGSDKKEN